MRFEKSQLPVELLKGSERVIASVTRDKGSKSLCHGKSRGKTMKEGRVFCLHQDCYLSQPRERG